MINSFKKVIFLEFEFMHSKFIQNEVTHLLYAHFYAFFKNNLNTLEIEIVVD